MKSLPIAVLSGAALVTMSFSGCETPGQGAGTGAVAGAIIGGIAGNNVRSAAIGAGAGAIAGAVVGKIAQDERRAGYVEGQAVVYPEHYRVATPSRYYGYVISPYRPHAMVDIRGIRPGARVVDPVSGRIFINP
ncbi:MAG: glycine zipper domain-containing protein [Chthoniobacteraceae bacterium]|nr:glycine zipper domain-containing protein [Chthoniobacteraceae bacterium]